MRLNNYNFYLVTFTILLVRSTSLWGQSDTIVTSIDSIQLSVVASPITVHAKRINIPFTISSIDQKSIDRNIEPTILPLLNATPGLWMQSGALNTNRISIRGVGYREPFATTGIKIYLDEIPLTNGVGESSIEDIHPNILSGIDIWRGPTSALWGSGLGGMIHLKSHIPEENHGQTKLQVGSFGRLQFDQHLSLRYGQNNQWGTALHYQYINDDGFRENNQYRKNSFTWLQQYKGKKGLTLNAIVHAIGLKAFIPSSLTLEDYQNNPSAAAPTWAAVMGNEDYTKWITGLNAIYTAKAGWVYRGSVFSTFFDSDEVRPFNVLDESNTATGMRHRFTFPINENGHVTAGIEFYNERYQFSTYETLQGGTPGPLLTEDQETRKYLNSFVQTEWQIGQKWFLFGGLNTSLSKFSGEDIEAITPVDFFPTAGLSYALINSLSLSASVSRGYSSLSLDDMLDSDGMLNTDIVPETGWSEELSLKYASVNGSSATLTLFSMNLKNTLLTRRIMDDVFERLNGGSSIHQGLELGYNVVLIREKLLLEGAYTFAHYRFDDFVEAGTDFSGNQLPGNPAHRTYTRLNVTPWSRWIFYVEHHWVDDVWLNDANTITGEGYQLLNAGLSYSILSGDRWNSTVSTSIHNLLDTSYSPMFQINAPGTSPRYYYPGKPLSIYVNINIGYKL